MALGHLSSTLDQASMLDKQPKGKGLNVAQHSWAAQSQRTRRSPETHKYVENSGPLFGGQGWALRFRNPSWADEKVGSGLWKQP